MQRYPTCVCKKRERNEEKNGTRYYHYYSSKVVRPGSFMTRRQFLRWRIIRVYNMPRASRLVVATELLYTYRFILYRYIRCSSFLAHKLTAAGLVVLLSVIIIIVILFYIYIHPRRARPNVMVKKKQKFQITPFYPTRTYHGIIWTTSPPRRPVDIRSADGTCVHCGRAHLSHTHNDTITILSEFFYFYLVYYFLVHAL